MEARGGRRVEEGRGRMEEGGGGCGRLQIAAYSLPHTACGMRLRYIAYSLLYVLSAIALV